jgi:hypothetical protein
MVAKEAVAAQIREITTRRRDGDQAIARAIQEEARQAETARQSLGTLDAELEEEIRRIREAFDRKRADLHRVIDAADRQKEELRREQDGIRTKAELQIAETIHDAARGTSGELHARRLQLRQTAERRAKRDAVLAADPGLSALFQDYQRTSRFRDAMASADLPAPVRDAMVAALDTQTASFRQRLAGAVPLDAEGSLPREQIVLFYDVSRSTDSAPDAIHVVTPCPFEEYEQREATIAMWVAAGVVRAVAEVQRALCPRAGPILYRNAGGMLVVAGILTEGADLKEASQMTDAEVTTALSAIPSLQEANLDPAMLELPPGILARLLATPEIGRG